MKTATVKLRRRARENGRTSLFLDIYYNGRRKQEHLGLYLEPDTRANKAHNKDVLALAEAICAKKTLEYRNAAHGFDDKKGYTLFFDYFEEHLGVPGWEGCYVRARQYEKNKQITFNEIDAEWVNGFKTFLDNTARNEKTDSLLAINTKWLLFSKLKACFNSAVRDGIISVSPARNIPNFKRKETARMYLTQEEVKHLAASECIRPGVKDAFLFSCLTGMRFSDIAKLRKSEVHEEGGKVRLVFRQKKTGGQEYLDINSQAAEIIMRNMSDHPNIFAEVAEMPPATVNYTIETWVRKSGIDKSITFHCARHTFAVMMISLGADIYTVSKLLGHKDISTTQIYAKLLDEKKQEAVSRIPQLL